jgi:hypothetical protein
MRLKGRNARTTRRWFLGSGLSLGLTTPALRASASPSETPVSGGQLVIGQFPEPAMLTTGLTSAFA